MNKTVKTLLIIFCCIAVVAGAIFVYARVNAAKPVTAVCAGNWMMSYMPNQTWLYGVSAGEGSQTVSLGAEEKLLDLYVSVGDSVKVGDPLFKLDGTKKELELEEKRLKLARLEQQLMADYKTYKSYARAEYDNPLLTPTPKPSKKKTASIGGNGLSLVRLGSVSASARTLGAPEGAPLVIEKLVPEISEAVVTTTIKQLKAEAANRKSTVKGVIKTRDGEVTVTLYANDKGLIAFSIEVKDGSTEGNLKSPKGTGTGRAGHPYVYAYPNGEEVDEAFVAEKLELSKNRNSNVYVRLENTHKKYLHVNDFKRYESVVTFTPSGEVTFYVTVYPVPTPTPKPTETPSPTAEPTPEPYHGGGMSKEEREELIAEAKETILKDELSYRQLLLDIESLKKTVESGIVYCTVDGTVTVANPLAQDGETVVEVSGGNGVYVACVIGETDRGTYVPGTELTGFSYDSGMTVDCRITSVDDTPLTESYSNGGNPNSSAYIARMEVIGDYVPNAGEYIEFTAGNSLIAEGKVYLFEAFVSEENGISYVYVVRDGIVRREPVTKGAIVSRYVELTGITLTGEDYIVFPGEPRCRDGAKAELSTESVYYYGY